MARCCFQALEIKIFGISITLIASKRLRRPAENGSRGTDHGTAAPHFVMGGKVKGGLYGRQPSLQDLENDDLKFSVDYRSLYTTVGSKWWGVQTEFLDGGPYPIIDFI